MEYTIKAGDKNFRPLESWKPYFFPKSFTGSCTLTESCWWSIEDWKRDQDIKDWRKIKGLTSYFSPNNRHSSMIAWATDPQENVFRICAYTNYSGSSRQVSDFITVKAGEEFRFNASMSGNTVGYRIWRSGEAKAALMVYHDFKRPCVGREIGTWFGGANNAEGPYGDVATQDMNMFISFKIN